MTDISFIVNELNLINSEQYVDIETIVTTSQVIPKKSSRFPGSKNKTGRKHPKLANFTL